MKGATLPPSDADENDLLDAILDRLQLHSDAALAQRLDVDRTHVYSIRAGRRRLGVPSRIKLLDEIQLLDDGKLQVMLETKNLLARIRQRWSDTLKVGSRGTDDLMLLDLWKCVLKAPKDKHLAAALGMSAPAVARVRAGLSSLGVMPKLRILSRVEPAFPFTEIDTVLKSTFHLLALVRQKTVSDHRQQGLHQELADL
jgi:transcriptional regulator with XRE-family HTH domain